jgi:hypothetical protein
VYFLSILKQLDDHGRVGTARETCFHSGAEHQPLDIVPAARADYACERVSRHPHSSCRKFAVLCAFVEMCVRVVGTEGRGCSVVYAPGSSPSPHKLRVPSRTPQLDPVAL